MDIKYEERCEKFAERLLEGPMRRKNWGAEVRDNIKTHVQGFVQAETQRIIKEGNRAIGKGGV